MRNRREHHHNNDDEDPRDDHTPPEARRGSGPMEPGESTEIRDLLAAEFADYLADVVANAPHPDNHDTPKPARTQPTPAPVRPNLRLITSGDDNTDTADWDEPLTVADAVTAARTTRRRVVRSAAAGTALVVGAGVVAGWGEPAIVTGPLAVYGIGWLGYLWWNAALRPSLGQVLAATYSGVRAALTVVITTLAALAHSVIGRVESARSRHETTRTSPATPSA